MNDEASGRVTLCADGKYRWYYEFPMMKNPVILFTVIKVLLIAAFAPGLITFFASIRRGFGEAFKAFAAAFFISAGIMCVLSVIAYIILAAMYGWKYIVLFEMDDEGVIHAQQDKQFKQNQAVAWLTALAGAASGKMTVAGAGLLAGSKSSTTSVFENVETVIGLRSKNTIKVNQLFARNQVYVLPEDYDFVWEYITSRCKKAKIKE